LVGFDPEGVSVVQRCDRSVEGEKSVGVKRRNTNCGGETLPIQLAVEFTNGLENSRLEVRHFRLIRSASLDSRLKLYLPKPGSARIVTKKMRTPSPLDLDAATTDRFPDLCASLALRLGLEFRPRSQTLPEFVLRGRDDHGTDYIVQ
jgi:hypothetical protein